jgi:hypothetical protein
MQLRTATCQSASVLTLGLRLGQPGLMLSTLTGSSCSCKTTIARACTDIDGLVVHDFDELSVPSTAAMKWRQRTLEDWIPRIVEHESRGEAVLLTGQSPLGEVLACPSAPHLAGIAVCLLDVPDDERLQRLERRDPGRWDESQKQALLGWARWHREHAADPQARPEVITAGGWDRMRWDRWLGWTHADPRWRTTVIQTAQEPVDRAVDEVREWISDVRHELATGRLSLAAGWL